MSQEFMRPSIAISDDEEEGIFDPFDECEDEEWDEEMLVRAVDLGEETPHDINSTFSSETFLLDEGDTDEAQDMASLMINICDKFDVLEESQDPEDDTIPVLERDYSNSSLLSREGSILKRDVSFAQPITPMATSSSHIPVSQWQWGDNNVWRDEDKNISRALDDAFKDGLFSLKLKVSGEYFLFDLKTLIRTNTTTKFQRKIRRIARYRRGSVLRDRTASEPSSFSSAPKLKQRTHSTPGVGTVFQWQWEEKNAWHDEDMLTSASLEEAYQNGMPSIDIVVAETEFTFDLETLLQTNKNTNNQKKVRRIELLQVNTWNTAQFEVDEDGEALITAAISGDVGLIETLLDKNVNVDFQNERSETALIRASNAGYGGVVDLLIDDEADVNLADKFGMTPLHYACENGDNTIAKALCGTGLVNANVGDEKRRTPFHLACQSGDFEVIKTLVLKARGLNILSLDELGKTSLHYACENENVDIVRALCGTKRFDVNYCDKEGETALMVASRSGQVDVVELLIEFDGDVDLQDKGGSTALFCGACSGHAETVKKLIDHSADVNHTDAKGRTALILACRGGHHDVFKALFQKTKELQLGAVDESGMTLLHYACESGSRGIVRDLCGTKMFRVNSRDKKQRTAFHLACRGGHFKVIKALFLGTTGLNISTLDDEHTSPLEYLLISCMEDSKYENEAFQDVLKLFTHHELFELIMETKTGPKTVYELMVEHMGFKSNYCIDIFGKENFTYLKAIFISFEELLEVKMINDSGANGAVYKALIDIAHHKEVNEEKHRQILIPIVCKVSKEGAGANEWFELQVLQNLPAHKNVVGLVAMCAGFKPPDDRAELFYTALIINFKSGGSLKERKVKRTMPSTAVDLCRYGLDIACSVEHMHKNGYKHCDIAARNFLFSQHYTETVVSITDFGLSRPLMDRHTRDTRLPIRWSAPETLERLETSIKSDVWMVGITFFELTTKPYVQPYGFKWMFNNPSGREMIDHLKVGHDCYMHKRSRAGISAEWIKLCRTCWSLFEEMRPSLEDIKNRLSDMLEQAKIEEAEAVVEPESPTLRSPSNVDDIHFAYEDDAIPTYGSADVPLDGLQNTYGTAERPEQKHGADEDSQIDPNLANYQSACTPGGTMLTFDDSEISDSQYDKLGMSEERAAKLVSGSGGNRKTGGVYFAVGQDDKPLDARSVEENKKLRARIKFLEEEVMVLRTKNEILESLHSENY